MKHLTAALVAAATFLPGVAAAQIKTLPGDSITVTATIEAIERSTRHLTLKGQEGNIIAVTVPAEVKRFDELKVGDRITAKYYENITLRVKAPGEPAVDTTQQKVTPGTGARPAGTSATQRTVTATITAIDPNVASITLSGPNNWKYSSRVTDKAALAQVKVGDRLDVVWTEAVLVSVDTPPAK